MSSSPRRRWFRFSLRTLFVVVTVLAVFIAYHVNWIHQRHEFIEVAPERSGYVASRDPYLPNGEPQRPPGLLWIFGETGYFEISLKFHWQQLEPSVDGAMVGMSAPPLDDSDLAIVERCRWLFPEAQVDAW